MLRAIWNHLNAPRQLRTKIVFGIAFRFGIALLNFVVLHGPTSGIQSRVAFARNLQRSIQTNDYTTAVVDEENPEPILRIQNSSFDERKATGAAAAFIKKLAPQLTRLGFEKVQFTDGKNIWSYPIK